MKKILSLLFGIILLNSIVLVSAEEINIDTETYSVWDNFIFQLKKVGLFTAAGQARDCSTTSDYTLNPASGNYLVSSLLSGAGATQALINVFDSNWNFEYESRSEDIQGDTLVLSGTGIIEVYSCPYKACNSNADCSDPYGNTCNIAYGACYYSEVQPTHSTNVYQCSTGNWNFQRTTSFGEENWCDSPSHNNYIREGQTIGGCYSPGNQPESWCVPTVIEPTIVEPTLKQTGEFCLLDNHCQSGDCSGFECVGEPIKEIIEEEIITEGELQKGVTESQIKIATTNELLNSVCTSSNQCETNSSCNSLQFLVNKEHISDIKAIDIAESLSGKIEGYCSGIGILNLLCITTGANIILEDIKEVSLEKTGLCISEEEKGFTLSSLAFMDVTGDGIKNDIDAIIILVVGLFTLVLLIRR